MSDWTNQLYFGDNLSVLRDHIADESVDLIYLDPPFNSNATYNVLFQERSGEDSAAQITAFDDTWHWTIESEHAYQEMVIQGPVDLSKMLQAMREFLGQNDMMAYLTMMAQRLVELHRVLKPTGSIYLHCDPTASHYLKLLMDSIFGSDNFLNEIVWKRTTAHNDPNRYGRVSDRLFFYGKSAQKKFNRIGGEYSDAQLRRYRYSDEKGPYRAENLTAPHFSPTRTVDWRGVHPGDNRQWRFSLEELERLYSEGRILLRRDGLPRKDGLKSYLSEAPGAVPQDVWIDIGLAPTSNERLGYPTQKPEALLERIINASSNEGDVVLDPFCGCGTAVAVAERLKRRWIGIDVTHVAVSLMKHRLHDTFGTDLSDYAVIGLPEDVASARALARESEHDGRYQFQYWAVGLVDARPTSKKGADGGIDGFINFFDDNSGRAKRIIVQAKSGSVQRRDIATLKGDMERENAAIGIFITLEEPTEPMRQEAIAAGFYEPDSLPGNQYTKVQIYTIEELLSGASPEYPRFGAAATFRQAPRQVEEGQQGGFFGD